jgi:hypothetical protein
MCQTKAESTDALLSRCPAEARFLRIGAIIEAAFPALLKQGGVSHGDTLSGRLRAAVPLGGLENDHRRLP